VFTLLRETSLAWVLRKVDPKLRWQAAGKVQMNRRFYLATYVQGARHAVAGTLAGRPGRPALRGHRDGGRFGDRHSGRPGAGERGAAGRS